MCLSLICCSSQEEMKVGEGFVPECASMLAMSLLALGGLDHTLESIVQCYWLCLHLSSVPMKFRRFSSGKEVCRFTIYVVR